MRRSIRSQSPFIEVYRWSDGSVVYLVELSKGDGSALEYGFQICLQDREPLTIRIKDSLYSGSELSNVGQKYWVSRHNSADLEPRKKLLGFIFDLMGRECLFKRELVWEDEEGGSSYIDLGPRGPTVVSDEAWLNRYEDRRNSLIGDHRIKLRYAWRGGWEAEENPNPDSPMAFVDHLPRKIWYTEFENDFCSSERDSAAEAIDDALRAYPIVPVSGLEEWFQDNLERGTWVKPTPEEVQLWEILDEKLPFFWSYEDLKNWLEG